MNKKVFEFSDHTWKIEKTRMWIVIVLNLFDVGMKGKFNKQESFLLFILLLNEIFIQSEGFKKLVAEHSVLFRINAWVVELGH